MQYMRYNVKLSIRDSEMEDVPTKILGRATLNYSRCLPPSSH